MGCFRLQFSLLKNILNVEADVLLGGLKQISHVLLRQPDALIFQSDFNLHPSVFRAIDEELTLGWRIGFLGMAHVSKISAAFFAMTASHSCDWNGRIFQTGSNANWKQTGKNKFELLTTKYTNHTKKG